MFGDVGCFNYRDKTVDYGIFVDDDDGVLTTRAITMYNCKYKPLNGGVHSIQRSQQMYVRNLVFGLTMHRHKK